MKQRRAHTTKYVNQVEINGNWYELNLVRNVVNEFIYSNLRGDTVEMVEDVPCKNIIDDLTSIGLLRNEGGDRFTSPGFKVFRQEIEKLSQTVPEKNWTERITGKMFSEDNPMPSVWLVFYSVLVTILFGFYLHEASEENQALTAQVKELSTDNEKLHQQLDDCTFSK